MRGKKKDDDEEEVRRRSGEEKERSFQGRSRFKRDRFERVCT